MSFEDQLRREMNRIDYSDRDRLLRESAKKCVDVFRDDCLSFARMGKSYHSRIAATKEPGKTHFIYAVADDRYEAARAKGSPLPHLGEHIFIRLSEAELFQSYVREEFKKHDMLRARISMEEDSYTAPKRGMFGGVRQATYTNNRYRFELNMSW